MVRCDVATCRHNPPGRARRLLKAGVTFLNYTITCFQARFLVATFSTTNLRRIFLWPKMRRQLEPRPGLSAVLHVET